MTAAEICMSHGVISSKVKAFCCCTCAGEVIADKHRISHPQSYALFTVINGQGKK